MPTQTTDPLVRCVIEAMAYSSQALAAAASARVGDAMDEQVFVEQADAAGAHLANALWALHPRWRDLGRRDAEMRALEVFRRFCPDIDEDARGPRAVAVHLDDAGRSAVEGIEVARSLGRDRRYRDIASELAFAVDHLENALYVVDPDGLLDALEGATPSDRVKLASRLEVIELELEEHREMIRLRREEAEMS